MRRIRETLRLHLQAGLSYNEVAHASELLDVPALDIGHAVATNFENAERAADYSRWRAVHNSGSDAGLTNPLSGKVRNAGDIFPAAAFACLPGQAYGASINVASRYTAGSSISEA